LRSFHGDPQPRRLPGSGQQGSIVRSIPCGQALQSEHPFAFTGRGFAGREQRVEVYDVERSEYGKHLDGVTTPEAYAGCCHSSVRIRQRAAQAVLQQQPRHQRPFDGRYRAAGDRHIERITAEAGGRIRDMGLPAREHGPQKWRPAAARPQGDTHLRSFRGCQHEPVSFEPKPCAALLQLQPVGGSEPLLELPGKQPVAVIPAADDGFPHTSC